MGKSLSDTLTYSAKLTRDTDFIERLIQDGKNQAGEFLEELENPVIEPAVK